VGPGGGLVLEHAGPDAPPPLADLELEETRRYGDTAVSFYEPSPRRAG